MDNREILEILLNNDKFLKEVDSKLNNHKYKIQGFFYYDKESKEQKKIIKAYNEEKIKFIELKKSTVEKLNKILTKGLK